MGEREYKQWRALMDPLVDKKAHLKLGGIDVRVISVQESPRRSKLQSAAHACGFGAEQLVFVDAVDGRNLTEVPVKKRSRSASNCASNCSRYVEAVTGLTIIDGGTTKCSALEIASSASHVMAVHAASQAGLDRVLICEDDVHLGALAAWQLSLDDVILKAPAKWGGLALFRSSVSPDMAEFSSWSESVSHNWGVVCYLLNKAGMKDILSKYKVDNTIKFGTDFSKAVPDAVIPHGITNGYVVSSVGLPPDLFNSTGAINANHKELHMRAASAQICRLLRLSLHTISSHTSEFHRALHHRMGWTLC